jgi:hypothetical protein
MVRRRRRRLRAAGWVVFCAGMANHTFYLFARTKEMKSSRFITASAGQKEKTNTLFLKEKYLYCEYSYSSFYKVLYAKPKRRLNIHVGDFSSVLQTNYYSHLFHNTCCSNLNYKPREEL